MGNQEDRDCLYEFLKTSPTMDIKIMNMSSNELECNLRGANGFQEQISTFSKSMVSFVTCVDDTNADAGRAIAHASSNERHSFNEWVKSSDVISSCMNIIEALAQKKVIKRKVLSLFAIAVESIKEPISAMKKALDNVEKCCGCTQEQLERSTRRCHELILKYTELSEHLDCFARVFKEYVETPKSDAGVSSRLTTIDLFYNYLPCIDIKMADENRISIVEKVMEEFYQQIRGVLDSITANKLLLCCATMYNRVDWSQSTDQAIENMKEYLSGFQNELARFVGPSTGNKHRNAGECNTDSLTGAIEQAEGILEMCTVDKSEEFFDASQLNLINEFGDFDSVIDTATEFMEPMIEKLTDILHVIQDINTVYSYTVRVAKENEFRDAVAAEDRKDAIAKIMKLQEKATAARKEKPGAKKADTADEKEQITEETQEF